MSATLKSQPQKKNCVCVCVYAHIYVQLRFQVAQVSTMRFHRLSLCIWFLFHRNYTHFCPVVFLFMSSSFCPCCAHICTLVLALILPPLGEACVCNPWNHRDPFGLFLLFVFSFCCRGTQHFTGTVSNEATSEMRYPAWPAGRTCDFPLFRMARG